MMVSSPTSALCCNRSTVSFRRGDVLPHHPDCVWQLQGGLVRTLTWNEDGDLLTLGLWGQEDIFGRPLSQIHPYQIECLTPVQVTELVLPHHCLYNALLDHIRYTEELFSIASYKRVPLRLLKLLQWLAYRFGDQVEQGWMIDLCLTHQVLADIAGTSRVTVTRMIKQFEQEGKLTRLGKRLILLQDP